MPTFQYEAKFRVNLAKVVPQVDELVSKLNSSMSDWGCHEQIAITSEDVVPPLLLTVNRLLTKEEEYQMSRIIEAQVIQSFSKYDVRLTSFSRKSVTSKSSAV